MGVTSWQDYLELPADIVDEASALMNYEHEERKRSERHYRNVRGQKNPPPYSPQPYVSPFASKLEEPEPEPTYTNERTGREMVRREKGDGTVVTHRKIEDGELILWNIVGRVPPSFRGKIAKPPKIKKVE